ncbi:MAG: acyl carrier protein [Gammaproteobacteria bacterium]|nr:acyl carrier protein [Gammaproteobacteria bacterium]
MERKEIEQVIVKLIKDNMPDFENVEINSDTRINTEENFDSMTFVYIMCKIESHFDIKIAKRKWDKMQTFGDVVDAVEAELNKK